MSARFYVDSIAALAASSSSMFLEDAATPSITALRGDDVRCLRRASKQGVTGGRRRPPAVIA